VCAYASESVYVCVHESARAVWRIEVCHIGFPTAIHFLPANGADAHPSGIVERSTSPKEVHDLPLQRCCPHHRYVARP
jgi:hypothetical protein